MGAELRFAESPPPDERRRALRDALGTLVAGWRPLARDVLGVESRIDWVGRDGEGRCVIVLIAEVGEDLGLLAHGLAQREWVSARLADWVQLAPDAGLRPDAGVTVLLLAPSFSLATRAAVRSVGDSGLQLAKLRFVENGAGVTPLLEWIDAGSSAGTHPSLDAAGFRSGLSAADLDLTPEERAEFERE
jgi:hypothetical protein